jgi:glycine cleavage system transcriptional repressor
MPEYAVAAMGADRPGIVAALAGSLTRANVSIEDSSMTILGGQFAMLLLVSTMLGARQLEAIIRPVALDLDLLLEVRDASRTTNERTAPVAVPSAVVAREHVIAAYGPNRPGLVAAIAEVLAEHRVNITDFGSRLGGDTFAMWFNVVLPDAPPGARSSWTSVPTPPTPRSCDAWRCATSSCIRMRDSSVRARRWSRPR